MKGEEPLFPSGPWTGFYNYGPGDRHHMDLHLTFAAGRLSGDGTDDIARFLIRGRYDASNGECYWTKSYVGRHDVFYRGFREGKGIWGTWEITIQFHGGFHIWPCRAGENEKEREHEPAVDRMPALGQSLPTSSPDCVPPGQPVAPVGDEIFRPLDLHFSSARLVLLRG